MLAIPNRFPPPPKVMITCTRPNPGHIEGVTGGVDAIGCRISFILDSQKRREWGKLEGGELASVKSTEIPFTLAAMVA
jgi:hypothetical protein